MKSTLTFLSLDHTSRIHLFLFFLFSNTLLFAQNNVLEFTCPSDTVIVNSFSPDSTGFPIFADLTLVDTFYYLDVNADDFCDDLMIRNWTIKSNQGDQFTCTQRLTHSVDVLKTILPSDITLNYCAGYAQTSNLEITGRPTIYDLPLYTDEYNDIALILVKTDVSKSPFLLERNYQIVNWCKPADGLTNLGTQLINLTPSDECPIEVSQGDETIMGLNITNGGSVTKYIKTDDCAGTVSSNSITFKDDGVDENYYDNIIRNDTVELCANDDQVRLVFTSFDLESGDTLFAYLDNLNALRNDPNPIFRSATGIGVSQAFGGWIDADCFNDSGCLTFIFKTNGDGISGAGWDAWWDCREVTEKCPANIVVTNSILPEDTGMPDLSSCRIDTIYYQDESFNPGCDFNSILTREWFVESIDGQAFNCIQELTINKSIEDIILPANIDLTSCFNKDKIEDLSITGTPTIYKQSLSISDFVMGYLLVVKDSVISETLLQRNFSILDWCSIELGIINIGHQQIRHAVFNDDETNDCQIPIFGNSIVQFSSEGDERASRYIKIDDCSNVVTSDSPQFKDDNSLGVYLDNTSRNDTLELCATQGNISVVFTDFSVSSGDSLFAYQGDLAELRNSSNPTFRKASGVGVAKAFGGWIDTNCSINPSGCLTFIFKTNGDGSSGAGWESFWDCKLEDADNDSVSDCDDLCPGGDDRINTDGVGMPDDCDCDPNDPNDEYIDLSLNGNLTEETYRASYQLSFNGNIQKEDNITFYAGREIILKPGFHASVGSKFLAKIDIDCSEQANNLSISNYDRNGGEELPKLTNDFVNLSVYPNPFKEQTNIKFIIPKNEQIKLSLYNIWGAQVKVLKNGFYNAGQHEIILNSKDLPIGTYYLTLQTKGDLVSKKLIVVQWS